MARIGAPGTGFSSIDSSKSVDTFAGLAAKRRMSSRARSYSSSRRKVTPKITPSVVTEVYPGLFKYRDPITGKLSFTSSREFAESSAKNGTPEFTQAFQEAMRTGGSGSSSGTPRAFTSEAAAKQDIKLREISRLAVISKTESNRQQLIAQKNLILQKQAKAELSRIMAERSRLIKRGAKRSRRESKDVKTGDKIIITRWRLKNGTWVQKIENLTKGFIEYKSYVNNRLTGGVTEGIPVAGKATAADIASKVIIRESNDPNKLIVTFPNGQRGTINSRGTVTVGKNLAGHKYLFKDGVIIAVDGKTTYAREEFVSAPTVGVAPPKLFKRITGAFDIKKFKAYREKQRQEYYDLYGLKGADRNFASLAEAARTKKLTVPQQNKFNKMTTNHLKQDLLNPDTAIRAEAALVIAAVATGPLLAGAIGAVYKTPIALAKNLGVEESLKDVSWKDVAKKGGVEFGKNAIQSYVALKLFGIGAKAISRIPSLAKFGLGAVGLKRAGVFTDKALKFALRKGLNIAGAEYLSSVGVDVAKLGIRVKQKRYKAATVQAAGLLGVLVGFYGEKVVKGALRKILLQEDPRLILTKGTSSKPFAVENRDITVARLNKIKKNLKGRKKIGFAKASPVREPRSKKIVTPELRTARGFKIDVPTPSGYATYAVGKEVYVIPNTFLKRRPGNLPKTYYIKWFKSVKAKGLLPTFKELGLPKTYKPTIYKGSGEYLPRNKGESLKAYYARGLKTANRLKVVQVVAAPKTVLGSKQPELEIKTIYPNPKGVKASVTRVKVGKDAFGHDIVVEIVAPKSIIQRIKFKIKAKAEFKKEALKYLTNREAKIAKDLSPRIIENYNLIYKSKAKGSAQARNHMLKVEQNFRKILKQYGIKATDAEIKATSRLHDILKLRGVNVKDEPIIRKAILEGYLNEIPLIKKLSFKQRVRVANTIGWHQDVNPKTLKALRLDKFTKAFINADRLDITRYGIKVKQEKLFNINARRVIPKNIKTEFAKLNKLRINKKSFTSKLRTRYNSLVKKYPGLKGKKFEDKIIAENKARYKKMTPAQKAKIRKQEKGYKDYKESLSEYQKLKKGKKIVILYRTSKYKTYNTPKQRNAYRMGYTAGYNIKRSAPTNYKTNKGHHQPIYAAGYKASYKGDYKINYKTGKYIIKTLPKPRTKYKRTPVRPPKRPPTKKKPPATPKRLPKGFKKKTISKAQPVYYIKVKSKGRMVNLTPRPLILRDAKDYLAYKLDKNLVRTAYFEPIGKSKNVVRLPSNIRGYYSKVSHKIRPYKIKVGKKKMLRNGFIEKRKYALDQKTERAQLQRSKKRKSSPKRKTRTTKKKR